MIHPDDRLIEIYCENIRRLGEVGVKVLCYKFMPLFDWMRTDLAMVLPDGSTTMHYDHGRMIWGESGIPGYGLYDRALGATYLLGVWQGLNPPPRTARQLSSL